MPSETIELVLREMRARRFPEAKELLDGLGKELENPQKFFDEIKEVVEKHEK